MQAVLALRSGKYQLADERLLAAAQSKREDLEVQRPSLAVLAALLLALGEPGDSYASLERIFKG